MSQLVEAIRQVSETQQDDIYSLKRYFNNNFPKSIKALQIIDNEYIRPKRRKGFNLVPRESKKKGIIYYARFSHNGVMLPTKFNTYTSDIAPELREAAAEQYAIKNKDKLIEQYLAKKDGRIYKFLSEFYMEESNIPEVNILSDRNRRDYENKIINAFIPFLKNEKIISFDQIKKTTLTKYQDYALSGKIKNLAGINDNENIPIKPQSVSNYMKPVKKIFEYLARKGEITDNAAELVKGLPVGIKDIKPRGCYYLDMLKGVFNMRWKDDLSCLLCVIIYTTGMRNSEITRISLEDIIKIGSCRFIQIKESKTKNGLRLVPLHEFVYKKIISWANKTKRTNLLFDDCTDETFIKANACLAKMLNVSADKMKEDNITFYSGRHFYKTLLNAEGLGENIEEIFMGHKVGSDVRQSYNHRDKQGKERLEKKAKQAISILDRCIFKNKAVRTCPHGRRGGGDASPAKK